jgi:UDP-N-acetylglucosamine:LPS N-acetylglucosamine transferase
MNNRLLVVASNGGHLVQLLRLQKSFSDFDITLISTSSTAPTVEFEHQYFHVKDSNFNEKFALVVTAWQTLRIILKVRPKVVVSTGAAPGLFCILWARIIGGKAIWIDSIANTEKLSLSGKLAHKLTPHCFSQWPDVAEKDGVGYIGAII